MTDHMRDPSNDDARITSYMWYIHVIVRVNAADRLWHSLAQLLGHGTTKTTRLATNTTAPPYPSPVDIDDINGINDTNRNSGGGSSSNQPSNQDDVLCAANKIDDLADHLVLDLFARGMLEALVNTAPIEVHKGGYDRILAGIPAYFREEFCRRLYCLLFSKYILEWPSGIAVPDHATSSTSAATSVAAASTVNTARVSSTTGPETVAMSTDSEIPVGMSKANPIQAPKKNDAKKDEAMFDMNEVSVDDEADETFDGEDNKHPVSPEPWSPGYQSTLGPSSPWPDTPSPGYSSELSRAAYFGTVSDPRLIQYLGDCGRSREDGPARGAYAGGSGPGACAGAGAGASHDERLLGPSWNRRSHPVPPGRHPTRPASLACGPGS